MSRAQLINKSLVTVNDEGDEPRYFLLETIRQYARDKLVEKATKLLGAAEALRQKIEIDMTPPERDEYDKEVADLKANMDEKEFASLWTEGRSMTMDDAIELAVEDNE